MGASTAQAIIFGLALGDALGWPTEFRKLDEIYKSYGGQGIQVPPEPALYTDDTQMTIALAEGLLDAGLDADLDEQMRAVGKRFIVWANSPENNRAPGNTCMTGVRNLERGISWQEAGVRHSKGCGSAMRVATIGYFYQHDEDKLLEVAHASGIITHGHPAAIAASIAAAYLVKLALDGVSPQEYLQKTVTFCSGISSDFDEVFKKLLFVLAWDDEVKAMNELGEGWVGEEAVALALYCVLRNPDNYVAAVRRGANSNGDSDSIACIAGGILGARLGLQAIPFEWQARCENRDYLIALANRMALAKEAYAQS